MANNKIVLKRTSTAGRTPNTTGPANLQYIAAGELALNMTDQIVYTSDGTNLITVGANLANQRITNSLTLDNDKNLYFKTVNTSAAVGFRQQNDDNFVFYSTNTAYGQRAVWSIFANSITSAFSLSVPAIFNSNVNLGSVALTANGTTGSAGQILASNGSATYWVTPSAASVNTAAQFTWSNLHTFSANVSFTGNGIGLTTNTGAIYLGGIADANWKIGRNTGVTTKWKYTNNTIDIVTANSNLEGMTIGLVSGNSYFETGYLGTFIANTITIGNSSSNSTVNSTVFSGTANNASYLGGTIASGYQTTAGLSANVATLTSNNASYLGGTIASGYQTTAGLSANVATLTANNTSYVNGKTEGNLNVNAAAKLTTPRTITVGGTGKSFDGTAAISFSTTEMGVEYQAPIGVPRSNLGDPTVREMALFSGQFTNKTELYDINNVFFETSTDNISWSTYSVSDAQKRLFLTGDSNSSVSIPYGTAYFRVRLRATAYWYLNALYSYFATQGHTTQVQVFKKHDLDANWTQHTSSTTAVNSWPGHLYLPFTTIPWNSTASQGTHYHEVYILFIPSWNGTYPSNNIALYKFQLWGGYPAGKRNIYTTNEYGDVTFPGNVTSTVLIGNVSGTYANISGQVNTATLYASTSANIASAVQANATGVYTTGTVNAASHTVGTSTVANSLGVYTGTVNAASHTVGTSTVANSLGVYTGIVNAATHSVGTAFTANATVVNAVSYYSGTLLVANNTVINATHLTGYNWSAPPVLGSTTANGASLTYANVSGQVNSASLYASGNVGIGIAPSSTIGLYSYKNWASDATLFNTRIDTTDSNTAMTASQNKFGLGLTFYNLNQNKSSDGLTTYNPGLYGSIFTMINGSTATGGDAYGSLMSAVEGRVQNFANGSTSNTIATALPINGTTTQAGSGIITTAYGVKGTVIAGNNSVTGNVTTAYGVSSTITSNTAMTIGTGYLYHGAHSGATTTTKYGIYLTGEANNYFSGNVSVAGSIYSGSLLVANSSVINATHLGGTIASGYQTTAGLSANVATLSSNNASYLGTIAAASYVQNTDSRTLSGNLVISGTYFNPSANTILLGNSIQRWVLSGNTGDFSGALNAASHTIGSTLIANTLGVYHTGIVNAATIQASATFTANSTLVNAAAINVTGQVNTVTLYATTSANVGANVQLTTSQLFVGNITVNSTHTSSLVQVSNSTGTSNLTAYGLAAGANVVANTTTLKAGNTTVTTTNAIFGGTVSVNGSIGTASQILVSGAGTNAYWTSNIAVNYVNSTGRGVISAISGSAYVGFFQNKNSPLYVDEDDFNFGAAMQVQNAAYTIATTKTAYHSQMTNLNQNRSADGLTGYNQYFNGFDFTFYNGSTATFGDARADTVKGSTVDIRNYANGSVANTITTAISYQGYIGVYSTGNVTTAYGSSQTIAAGNNSSTGQIPLAYAHYSKIESNTAMTIGQGYLFYGIHTGSTTTNKYGIYITGEANNYFSGNVSVAGSTNAASYKTGAGYGSATGGAVVNATVLATGNATINAVINSSAFVLNGVVAGGYYKGNNSNSINQAAAGNIFRVNSNTLTASVTFAAGENGTATGPVAIASGISLIISTGARVSIV